MAFFLIVSISKVLPLSGNSGLLFRPHNRAPGIVTSIFCLFDCSRVGLHESNPICRVPRRRIYFVSAAYVCLFDPGQWPDASGDFVDVSTDNQSFWDLHGSAGI